MKCPPVPNENTQAGFTLVETVLALALTAFLTAAAVTMVVQARRASLSVEAATQRAEEILYLQSVLRTDLDNIQVATAPPVSGSTLSDVSRELVLFTFTREGWPNFEGDEKRTESVRVAYRFEGGALVRRVWLSDAPNTQTPFVDRELYSGIREIRMNFRSQGSWLPAWPAFDYKLPAAITLRIDLESGERLELTTRVAHGR